jgi:excisionase family DNA binding protein
VTRALVDGTVVIDPVHSGLVAFLVREGTLAVGARRALPPQVAPLLAELERAAAAARSTAGTGVSAVAARSASWSTAEQAAEVLKVSPSYVRRLCRAGALIAERCGTVWLIDTDSLAGYALAHRNNEKEAACISPI